VDREYHHRMRRERTCGEKMWDRLIPVPFRSQGALSCHRLVSLPTLLPRITPLYQMIDSHPATPCTAEPFFIKLSDQPLPWALLSSLVAVSGLCFRLSQLLPPLRLSLKAPNLAAL